MTEYYLWNTKNGICEICYKDTSGIEIKTLKLSKANLSVYLCNKCLRYLSTQNQ